MTKKLPRGLRNNNPGNIRVSKDNWLGKIPADKKKDKDFEEFSSMAHGYRALIKNLQNYHLIHKLNTVEQFINRWAPPVENNTKGYIDRVCKDLKVQPSFEVDVFSKKIMCKLAASISSIENGVPAVIADIEAGFDIL